MYKISVIQPCSRRLKTQLNVIQIMRLVYLLDVECDKTEQDPDFGLLGGTTQHEGTGHQLIKSEKVQ